MKNFNTVLILVWILSGSILIVENVVTGQQAFVYITVHKTWVLCIACILTGIAIGWGAKWKLSEWPSEEQNFDF